MSEQDDEFDFRPKPVVQRTLTQTTTVSAGMQPVYTSAIDSAPETPSQQEQSKPFQKPTENAKPIAKPINFKAIDPSLLQKQEQEGIKQIKEEQLDSKHFEQTKAFKEQFEDKVDPFGQNKPKKVIKTTAIVFKAEDPASLGKAKQAEIGAAKFKTKIVKNAKDEQQDEDDQESPQVIQKQKKEVENKKLNVECEEDDSDDKPRKKKEPKEIKQTKLKKKQESSDEEDSDEKDSKLQAKMKQEKERLRKELEEQEQELQKQSKQKKKKQEDSDEDEVQKEESEDDESDEEKEKRKKKKKLEKQRRKEEQLEIKKKFYEKLISPFTEMNELIDLYMRPIPKEVGTVECTIS